MLLHRLLSCILGRNRRAQLFWVQRRCCIGSSLAWLDAIAENNFTGLNDAAASAPLLHSWTQSPRTTVLGSTTLLHRLLSCILGRNRQEQLFWAPCMLGRNRREQFLLGSTMQLHRPFSCMLGRNRREQFFFGLNDAAASAPLLLSWTQSPRTTLQLQGATAVRVRRHYSSQCVCARVVCVVCLFCVSVPRH